MKPILRMLMVGTGVATAMVLAGGLVTAGAAVADTADPDTITYSCVEPPYPSGDSDFTVTLSAPLVVQLGHAINLTATLESVSPTKVDVPAGGVTTVLTVDVTGSETTTVPVSGLTTTSDTPVGDQVLETGGTGSLTPTQAGVYLFRPSTFVTTTYFGTTLTCTPTGSTPVEALTVDVP